MNSQNRPAASAGRRAFTLIELLVVIAIIAILASMLYAADSADYYPVWMTWVAYGGQSSTLKSGDPGFAAVVPNGGNIDATNRPLNRYVANGLNVFRCPADQGDAQYSDVKSCWDAYGISYYMAFWFDSVGVRHVGGAANWGWPDPGNEGPIKTTEVARAPTKKVILGDFPWYGRNINNLASAWHNDKGRPLFPTLFGDGHVSNFLFPANPPTTASPTNAYW